MYFVRIRRHVLVAHSLQHPGFGPAQRLHGATYVVDAEFSTPALDAMNVVVDIDLAGRLLEEVLEPLNFRNLDELPAFQGCLTTTEFLAAYIHRELARRLRGTFRGNLKITLGESHVAWAGFEGAVE